MKEDQTTQPPNLPSITPYVTKTSWFNRPSCQFMIKPTVGMSAHPHRACRRKVLFLCNGFQLCGLHAGHTALLALLELSAATKGTPDAEKV